MAAWKSAWRVKVLLLLAGILLVSSCGKMKLNLQQLFNLEKNAASETAVNDWPRWRGLIRTGVSKETEWKPKSVGKWSKCGVEVNVGKGYRMWQLKVIISIQWGMMYALLRMSCIAYGWVMENMYGVTRTHASWQGGNGTQTTPTIAGEYVYTLSVQGISYAWTRKEGSLRWRKNIVEDDQVKAPFYGFAGSAVARLCRLTVRRRYLWQWN